MTTTTEFVHILKPRKKNVELVNESMHTYQFIKR